MCLIISGILVILGFIYKNNKKVFNLQFLWIWILLSFNNGGPDYDGYQEMFKAFSKQLNLNFLTGGTLYSLGAYIFNKFKFSLDVYTFFTTTIALILIYLLIKKYSLNIAFVNSCLILYPLVDNIIQKRNFLSMVNILYGIIFLINKTKYNIIKFLIFIFIAYNFHALGIIYILCILVLFFSLKKIKIISCIGLILISVFIFYIDEIVKLFFRFLSSKIYVYFEEISMRLPFYKVLFFIFIHLTMFYFIIFFYKRKRKKDEFSLVVIKLNYLFLLIIPLYYYNSTFFRFYRNIYLLNYIFIGNVLAEEKKNKLKKLFLFYIIALFLTYILLGEFKYAGLIKPLFKYNYILNIL